MKLSRLARCTLATAAIAVGSVATLDAPVSAAPILLAPVPIARPDLVVSSVSTISFDHTGPYTLIEGNPKYIKAGNTIHLCVTVANVGPGASWGTNAWVGTRGPLFTTVHVPLYVTVMEPHTSLSNCVDFVLPNLYLGNPYAAYSSANRWDFSVHIDPPGNNEVSSANNWGYGSDWTMVY